MAEKLNRAAEYFPNVDPYLQGLVSVVNFEFDITLIVGGLLVSGTVVSADKYFDGASTEFVNTFPEAERAGIKKAFTLPKPEPDEQNDPELPVHIHLRNARFFHPGGDGIPTNRGVWWRGRLSQVQGYILFGALGESGQTKISKA